MSERREAAVCFFTENTRILLALIRYPDGAKRWNGIGGFADENETTLVAVIREIKEEIDESIESTDLEEKLVLDDYPGIRLHVFLGKIKNQNPKIIDPTIEELKWFDFDEIPFDKMWEGNDRWLANILNPGMNKENK